MLTLLIVSTAGVDCLCCRVMVEQKFRPRATPIGRPGASHTTAWHSPIRAAVHPSVRETHCQGPTAFCLAEHAVSYAYRSSKRSFQSGSISILRMHR